MLGRTHMAIGALGAALIAPIILHTQWETLRQLGNGHLLTMPHTAVAEATVVAAAVAGSIMPDLDQADSLMAHKVERIGQFMIFAILAGVVVMLHLQTSMTMWALVLMFGLLSGARGNIPRILGLGVLAAGLVFLGIHRDIPLTGAILLAVWGVGAMFTVHRTFTHSLLGLAMFGAGAVVTLHSIHGMNLSIVSTGLITGYVLHLMADAFAGGVPLLWPWSTRQGFRFVRTGSARDHMIGGLAVVAFVGLAVL
jgi:membrane-bound metal-dependent hydrolase YbcI (DUF457 family)